MKKLGEIRERERERERSRGAGTARRVVVYMKDVWTKLPVQKHIIYCHFLMLGEEVGWIIKSLTVSI